MRDAAASLILRNRQALEVDLPSGRLRLRWLVVNAGTEPSARLVCLCWVGGGAQPAAAAKFARHPRFNARVEGEYRALEQLSTYTGPGRARVPKPVGATYVGRHMLAVETALHGRPLRTLLHERRGQGAVLLDRWDALLEWVTDLGVRSRRPASHGDYEEMVFSPLESAGPALGLEDAEQAALLRIREHASRLASARPLPVVFAHRDLGTPNVLVGSGGEFAGVVDWEDGGPGLPASDLLFFLGRFAYETRGAGTPDELRGFREVFFGEDAEVHNLSPLRAGRWLRRYCTGVGLDREWLPAIFALTWIAGARDERRLHDERAAQHPAWAGYPAVSPPTIQPDHFLQHLRFYLRHSAEFARAMDVVGDDGAGGRA